MNKLTDDEARVLKDCKDYINKGDFDSFFDYVNLEQLTHNYYTYNPYYEFYTFFKDIGIDCVSYITKLPAYFFAYSGIDEIELPRKITELNQSNFLFCHYLQKVKILGNVTTIPDSCFAETSQLQVLYLPDTITYIGDFAFDNCNPNVKIYISKSFDINNVQFEENYSKEFFLSHLNYI